MMNRILSWKLPDGKYAYIFDESFYKTDIEGGQGKYISDRISPNSSVWEGIIVKLNDMSYEDYVARFNAMNEEIKAKYGFQIEWNNSFYNFTQNAKGVNIVLLSGKDGNGGGSSDESIGDSDFGEEGIDDIDYNKIIKDLLDDEAAKEVFVEGVREDIVKYVNEKTMDTLNKAVDDLDETKDNLLKVNAELASQLDGAKEALNMASELFNLGDSNITPESIKEVFSNMDEYTTWMTENSGHVKTMKADYDWVNQNMGSIGEAENIPEGLFSRFATSLNNVNKTVGTVEETMSAAMGRIEDIATWADVQNSAMTEVTRLLSAGDGTIIDKIQRIEGGIDSLSIQMDEALDDIQEKSDNIDGLLDDVNNKQTELQLNYNKLSAELEDIWNKTDGSITDIQREMNSHDASIKDVISRLDASENTLISIEREMNAISGTIKDQISLITEDKLASMGDEMDAMNETMKRYMTVLEDSATTITDLRDEWSTASGKISTVAELVAETDPETGEVMYFVSGSTSALSDDIRVVLASEDPKYWKISGSTEENPILYSDDQVFVHYNNKLDSYIQQKADLIVMNVAAETKEGLHNINTTMNALEAKVTQSLTSLENSGKTLTELSEEWSKANGKISGVAELTAEVDETTGEIKYFVKDGDNEIRVKKEGDEWIDANGITYEGDLVYAKYNPKLQSFIKQTSSGVAITLTKNIEDRISDLGFDLDSAEEKIEQWLTVASESGKTITDLREKWDEISGKVSTVASLNVEVDPATGEVMYFISGSTGESQDDIRVVLVSENPKYWKVSGSTEENPTLYSDDQVFVHYNKELKSYIQQTASAITIGAMDGDKLKAAIQVAVEDEGTINMIAKQVNIDADVIAKSLSGTSANIGGICIGDGEIFSTAKNHSGGNAIRIDGKTGTLYASNAEIRGKIYAEALTLSNEQTIEDYVNGKIPNTTDLMAWVSENFTYSGMTDDQVKDYVQEQINKTKVNVSKNEDGSVTHTTTDLDGKTVTWTTYNVGDYVVFGRKRGEDKEGEDYFYVSSAGLLTARNAMIYGTVYATDGSFAGKLEAASGTFAGELSAASGTFSGELKAATGTFKGKLSAATGTFSGELSAAKGTFAGELSAASGTFAGELKAETGHIGGFTIGPDKLYSEDNTVILRGASSDNEEDAILLGIDKSERKTLFAFKASGSTTYSGNSGTQIINSWSSDTKYDYIYIANNEFPSNGEEIKVYAISNASIIELDQNDIKIIQPQKYWGTKLISTRGYIRVKVILGKVGSINSITRYEYYYKDNSGLNDLTAADCKSYGRTLYNTKITSNGDIFCNSITARDGFFAGTIHSDGYFSGELDCDKGLLRNASLLTPFFYGNALINSGASICAVDKSYKRYFTVIPDSIDDITEKTYGNAVYYRYIKNRNGNNYGQTYFADTDSGTTIVLQSINVSSGDTIKIPVITLKVARYVPQGKIANQGSYAIKYILGSSSKYTCSGTIPFESSGEHVFSASTIEKTITATSDTQLTIQLAYSVHLPTYSWLGMDKAAATISIENIGNITVAPSGVINNGFVVGSDGFMVRSGNYGLKVTNNGIKKYSNGSWVNANL